MNLNTVGVLPGEYFGRPVKTAVKGALPVNPFANMPAPETLSHEELCQTVHALQGRLQQLGSLAVSMNAINDAIGAGRWSAEYAEESEHAAVQWSDEFRRLLGYHDETDFINSWDAALTLVNPEDLPRLEQGYFRMRDDFNGKTVLNELCRVNTKDRGERWFRITGSGVHRPDGSLQAIYGLAIDMDEHQRFELELKQSAAAAREANEAKTRFLLNMSHDIRTPMNAIIGYTSLLDKYLEEPERARGYLSKILSSSEYLLSLINNVLEMSKIESGSMTLDEKPAPLGECIHEVLQVFEGSFREKNITVHADIELPVCSIYVDKVRIREIFLNIIGNALKYTPAGGHVTIHQRAELVESVGKEGKTERICEVTTTVSDSGRGISPQFLPRLFEEFAQEYSSVDGINNSGTGLGMTITRHLVELMGGTIAVESTVGVGTSFKIVIPHRIAIDGPTESAPPVTARAMESLTLEGRRVLLAEDNDLNAEIAMELLCLAGLKIDRACDGAECVAMVKNAPAGSYDLVLMDMQMPVMDGREAAEEIRKLGDAQKAAIPIVAMTATALDEDASWAKSLGMDGLISKPIDISAMIRVLSDILLKN